MRFLTVLLLSLVLTVPLAYTAAYASSGGEKKSEGHDSSGGGKKGDEDVSGGRFAGDPIYVRMEPLVVPVISEEGLQQMVTMLVVIEVSSFEAADFVHSHMPRVRDAIVRAIYGGLSSGDIRNGKMVNLGKAKANIAEQVRKVMKPDMLKDVLVEGVAQRMF